MRFVLLLFIAVTATTYSAARAASFDCSNATRVVDKMICADPELSQSDADLAQAYKAALAAMHSDQDRTTLRDSQRLWLARRDARCLRKVAREAAECLKDEYWYRIAQLEPKKAPTVARAILSTLADAALNAAHPKERAELEFPQGAFSPHGDLFAFGVSQIVSGDIDQVWIYSLADKKLVPATPSPVRDKTDVSIQGFSWFNSALYVQGTTGAHADAQTPFVRAATMAGSHETKGMPQEQVLPGAARDTTAAAGDSLSDQGDKRLEDARYEVISKNQGHGALTLGAHDKKTLRDVVLIATGSWYLSSFVFDAPRNRVIYPNGNGGIEIYSLASHKTVATIPVPINVLLDVTADGTLAAFSGNGRCDPSAPAADDGRRQVICFVKLPN